MQEQDLKQIKQIIDQSFKENFDKSFGPAFDKSFGPAFDKSFGPAFDKSFGSAFDKSFGPAFDKSFEEGIARLVKPSFDDVYHRLDKLDTTVVEMKSDISGMKKDIGRIRGDMVTVDYFSEKMADLKGDAIARERKIDEKVNIANNSLKRNKLLSRENEKRIAELQVFPSLDGLKSTS